MRYNLYKIRTVKVKGNEIPTIIQFGVTFKDEEGRPYESIYGALCSPQGTITPPKTYPRGGWRPTNAVQWAEWFKEDLAELFRTRPELKKMLDSIQPLMDDREERDEIEVLEIGS